MEIFDKRTASILSTIVLFIAAGAFIYFAARVLIVFVLAILFAYLLAPLVSRFLRLTRISVGARSIALLEVYLILCGAIGAISFVVGARVIDEIETLLRILPGWL